MLEGQHAVNEQDWKDFGRWIDGLRTRAGLSTKELAERADVSTQWLHTILKGGRTTAGEWLMANPRDDHLSRLATALGVPLAELMKRAGRPIDESITASTHAGATTDSVAEFDQSDVLRMLDQVLAKLEHVERRMDEVERLQHDSAAPEEPTRL